MLRARRGARFLAHSRQVSWPGLGLGGKARDFVGVPGSASTFLSAYIAPPGRDRRSPTRTCEEALSPTEWGLESICGANRYLPLHPTPKVPSAKLARHDPRRKRGHPIAHLPGHCYLRAKCKVGMWVATCGRARKACACVCVCVHVCVRKRVYVCARASGCPCAFRVRDLCVLDQITAPIFSTTPLPFCPTYDK